MLTQSYNIFNLNTQQLSFVQRTYTVLFAALALMTAIGLFSYFYIPPVAATPLMIMDSLLWVACGWFGWRNPIKAVFPLFLIVTGLALGQIAHLYHPEFFLSAAILTLAIFAGISSLALWSKKDFSFLRVTLNVGFWVLLAMSILLFFVQIPLLSLVLGLLGTAVFIGWILYDTSQIIHRINHTGYTPQFGAFDLFMDIIGLFSFVRHLLSQFNHFRW